MEKDYKIMDQQIIKDCSFFIRIKFRQRASFQGEINWIDNNQEKKIFFRSLLELISLMEEAMEINNNPKIEYKIRSWENEDDLY